MKPAEVLVGLGIAALGAFIAVETTTIEFAPVYAKVGPQVIPYIAAGGLVLMGLLFAGLALRAEMPPPQSSPTSWERDGNADWRALVVISGGLIAQLLLLERVGFVIAAALLFVCVTYGFGSRRYLRDVAIAALLAVIVYLGFTRGLDLHLPAGVLKGVL